MNADEAGAKNPWVQIPVEAKPASKSRHILPTVVGAVAITASLGFLASLHSRQIGHYVANASEVKELWTSEGMREEALERSIIYITKIKLALSSLLSNKLVMFLIYMCVAIFTESWVIDGKSVNGIIETIAVLYYEALPAARVYLYLISWSFLHAMSVILFLGTFYYFTRSKFGWKEQVVCMSNSCALIATIVTVFISDYKHNISPDTHIPLAKYEYMDAGLRTRIIKAANDNGIDAESVYVLMDEEANAAATKGLRFKYIFITSSIIRCLNADQLMSVVHHEIGHIINNHIIKSATIRIIFFTLIAGLAGLGYKKLSRHYNGLVALTLINAMLLGAYQIWMHFYMIYVSQRYEYEADFNAYAKEGYLNSHIESERILHLLDGYGTLFDYENWIARFRRHPSPCKRIFAAREYAKNK